MKKHIHKKCLVQFEAPEEIFKLFDENTVKLATALTTRDVQKNFNAILITEDKKVTISFQFNDNGRIVFIPEPDPILIYFDNAYHNFREIKNRRATLLNHFKGEKMSEDHIVALYAFFGSVNTFIIMLFTAL